jgi:SAM-dependent methyltransferase
MKRLSDAELATSNIVANSRMNRERGLAGANSYAKDLGMHPLEFLVQRLRTETHAAWLDLCCGSGKALVEAAREVEGLGLAGRISLRGVDLVPMFAPLPPGATCLRFDAAALPGGMPPGRYDLITCVHGLHYVGDKLGLIARAVAALTPGGLFAAHLDPANLRTADGGPLSRQSGALFARHGFECDRRRRVLRRSGPQNIAFGWRYLGADDAAGPNATGQEAVDSYYERASENQGGPAAATE